MADPLDDLPPDLAALIRRLSALIDGATEPLVEAITPQNVEQWQTVMEELLMRYHIAGYMRGASSDVVSDVAKARILELVHIQLGFLDNFALEVSSAESFERGWQARARSYASAIKVPYWTGRTKVLPLPAMPAQGTDCKNNCKCKWDVKTVDAANGDYDAYWIRHSSDSCATCVQRAQEWNPVRIRGGVLQLA